MRRLLSSTTALIGAVFAFGSTGASAGDYGHPSVRPVMGHHGMASPAYRPLPPVSYAHGPRVVYGSHGYGSQEYGSQGYGAPRMARSGPAAYGMYGASPRFARAPSGYSRPHVAGGYGGERYGRPVHRYGYGLAAATLGAAAGYGYGGGGYGDDSGYNQDTASNGDTTDGGYGAGEQPLTVHYAAMPGYGDGQQLSGGDDVQTNGYGSPYNPYQQAGYGGGGYGLSGGFGLGIPPAGGLAVYSPGAYGPGPSIIHIPAGYGYGGGTGCTCRAAGY